MTHLDLAQKAIDHCNVLLGKLTEYSDEMAKLRGLFQESLDLNTRLLDNIEKAGKLCLKVTESDCPQALKDEVLEYLRAKL